MYWTPNAHSTDKGRFLCLVFMYWLLNRIFVFFLHWARFWVRILETPYKPKINKTPRGNTISHYVIRKDKIKIRE